MSDEYKNCESCGEKNMAVRTYCQACYASFEKKEKEPPASPVPQRKSNKLILRVKGEKTMPEKIFRWVSVVSFACLTFYVSLMVVSRHLSFNYASLAWDYSSTMAEVGFFLAGIFLIGLIFFNIINADMNHVKLAWSQIDVTLKKRHDLIPKLVKTAESYMKYEKQVLTDVTRVRSEAMNLHSVTEKGKLEKVLNDKVREIMAVSENYPELKTDKIFHHLQSQITLIEEQIAQARTQYNQKANKYNIRIASFPLASVARACRFRSADYFQAEEDDRLDPVVEFE